jgi:mono/diheme cytochrome c family protein
VPAKPDLTRAGVLFGLLASLALNACAKPAPLTASTAVAEGRRVFAVNCSSCHNINPNLDGAVGPAIAGSSRALVEARVLNQSYPVGYKPKRPTHLMRALPWLAPKIDDLSAFLQTAQQQK